MTNKKATTKDELFLIKLYELAMDQGDFDHPIDRYIVGRAIGQNDRGVNTIVILLAKANFIKKAEGTAVFLTALGVNLVKSLIA